MFLVSFISLPLLTAGAAAYQASAKEAGGFFSGTSLDAAMWDALSEGILALLVFGLASVVMRTYRKDTSRSPRAQKAKLTSIQDPPPKGAIRFERARACPHGSIDARQPPAHYKATALASRTPPELAPPAGAHFANRDLRRTQSKISEADFIANAVKGGRTSELPQLLDAAVARSLRAADLQGVPHTEQEVATSLLHSAMRACAAARRFNEAIAAYDHMAGRIGSGSLGLWSVLLYITVEAKAYCRGKSVFENLCGQGSPSGHDFVNMVCCYACQLDSQGLREMLAALRSSGQYIDTYTWNRALAACGRSENALDLAEELAVGGICPEGLDAVGYNTLMKYNARAGRLTRCFQLREEMAAKGLEASEVTFGILLEVCVGANELDHARRVFDDLCSSGLRLNVVHCTTFIKALIGSGKLDEAAGVLREMVSSAGVKPDLITYSTVVKAYADRGDVTSAMKMVEQMLGESVKPDEIIYNSVLGGCGIFPMKSAHVMRTFERLICLGLRPTTTTLSILLKGLAHTEAWALSLQVLNDARKMFNLEPEMRLYSQLGQACVKARTFYPEVGRVFDAMLEVAARRAEPVDPVAVGRFLRSCLLGGAPELALELREKARQAGVAVDVQIEKMLKNALAKKDLHLSKR